MIASKERGDHTYLRLYVTYVKGLVDHRRSNNHKLTEGVLYLIATLDDHSRFVPAGRWLSTQGKIERFWKFVQRDFVPSVITAKTIDEVNGKWRLWLAWYNYKFKSSYFGNKTHAAAYRTSERKLKRVELEILLLIEERRKVTRESTISLYGKHYFVPPGYIGAGFGSRETNCLWKQMVRPSI